MEEKLREEKRRLDEEMRVWEEKTKRTLLLLHCHGELRDRFNYTERSVEEKLKEAKRRLDEAVVRKEEEAFKKRKMKLEEVERKLKGETQPCNTFFLCRTLL